MPDTALERREQQNDALGLEPACGEGERVSRRLIEPVRVVDHREQRCLFARLSEQTEDSDTNEEAIPNRCLPQAQGATECRHLRLGQPFEPIEDRMEELVEPGEGELGFRLDPDRSQDPHVGGLLLGVREQRGLPDARLSAHDKGTTLRRPRAGDESLDSGGLNPPAVEHGPSLTRAVRVETWQGR